MNKQEFLQSIRKQIHFIFDRDSIEQEFSQHIEDSIYDLMSEGYTKEEAERMAIEQMGDPMEIGKQLNEEHHPLLGWLWKNLIIIIPSVMLIIWVILGSAHSGHYYSQPSREVDQLSTDYYLGPTINENNDKILNVKHFETLDGVTESASPIGYYIQFDYKDNEITCEIMINSFPFDEHQGDFVSLNVHVYEGYEIYVHDTYEDESKSNIVSVVSMAHLGDYLMDVNVPIIHPDNYDYYQKISLEFMNELIDNYIANDLK